MCEHAAVATIVSFHAHPDDEAISCGGTLARAAADGHRIVLVFATKGEEGEVPAGLLGRGETLADRRTEETPEAARILGVNRVEFLGYRDSGMMGTPENDVPGCFWKAEVEEAARRLAAVLREERADVLTIYDEHGNYGHPDHIQVHRVGARAGEMAGTPLVYEATADRDYILGLIAQARELGVDEPGDVDPEQLGVPGHLITTRVDVQQFLEQKRAAMAAHASQIAESSFFLNMPPEAFRATWGQEWFIRRGAAPGTQETDLLEPLG